MILTIHIDNRITTLVGYQGALPVVTTSLRTQPYATADQYAANIRLLLQFHGRDTDPIEGAVISSVVPALTGVMQKSAGMLTQGKVLTVCAGMKTGLNLRLDSAGTVGSDFICNAVAALGEFSPPLVILHLGDTTTFTAVDAQGVLCGRSILPGVESGLEHLCADAAQLPDVSFDVHAKLLGRGTSDAIRSGALYGAVSMVEGMSRRFLHAVGENAQMIAVGAAAELILPLCSQEILFRPLLLHDGLRLLYHKNQ